MLRSKNPVTTLTRQKAKEFYDHFGKKQDWQRIYEDRALHSLVSNGAFHEANAVLEYGCGTGRFAETLLEQHLGPSARYAGLDISETMAKLASARLRPFGARAEIILTDGSPRLDYESGAFDRFVSCYVLDLLPLDDIREVLLEAGRVLSSGGLLCLVGLTHGFTPISRFVERLWQGIYKARPMLVGGCRPISLMEFVSGPSWRIRFHDRYSGFGVPSEVLIAEKLEMD